MLSVGNIISYSSQFLSWFFFFLSFAVGKIVVSLLGKVIRLILFLLLNTDPSLAEYRKLYSVSVLLYTFSDTTALFSRIKHCMWEFPHFHFFFFQKKRASFLICFGIYFVLRSGYVFYILLLHLLNTQSSRSIMKSHEPCQI